MGSSFIEFKDNGFWARDGFVEAFQLLLIEEIQLQSLDKQQWMADYLYELGMQSLPLITGGMSMRFNETLTDKGRVKTILGLIESIINKIEMDTDYLTTKHLNSLREKARRMLADNKMLDWGEKQILKNLNEKAYRENLPVNNYLNGFILLMKLLKEELKYKADTKVDYWE